jgi:23S rRNA (adenine2503-C2)-methyltransferase
VSAEITNLLNFDRTQMEAFFTGLGEKKFRAHQMLKWIYHHGVVDFDLMTDFGKVLRAKMGASVWRRPCCKNKSPPTAPPNG